MRTGSLEPSITKRGRSVLALALALALAATACNGEEQEAPAPGTEPEIDEPATDGMYAVVDLEAILIPSNDAPDGTEHFQTFQDQQAVAVPIEHLESPEVTQAVEADSLGARAEMFSSDDLSLVVGSWGAVYEDPEAAAAAMSALVDGIAGDLGTEPQAEPGLGEDGVALQGVPASAPEGFQQEETNYVWRIGNLVLLVLGSPYEPADLRALAEAKNARALAIG